MDISEYLRNWRRSRRERLSDIETRAVGLKRPSGVGASASFFSRFESGKVSVTSEDLTYLAGAYELDAHLLSYFVSPERDLVVQLGKSDDFDPAPLDDQNNTGTFYTIARHRLAKSLLSVSKLEVKGKNKSNRDHKHPGEEVLVVQTGELFLIFPDAPKGEREKYLQAGDILHFMSSQRHYVENRSKKIASILVIRQVNSNPEQVDAPDRFGKPPRT